VYYNHTMDAILSKETIASLRYFHGGYNLLMALAAWSMLWLGLSIRRRRASGRQAGTVTSAHRRIGPVLAVLGPTGFLAGATLIVLDKGHVFEYPSHFIIGLLLALALPGMYVLSRALLRGSARARTVHRRLGISVAVVYLLQVLLGVGILL